MKKILILLLAIVTFSCGELLKSDKHYNLPNEAKISLYNGTELNYINSSSEIEKYYMKYKLMGTEKLSVGGTDFDGPFHYYEFEDIVICPNIDDQIDSCSYTGWYDETDIMPQYEHCNTCILILKSQGSNGTDIIIRWQENTFIKTDTSNFIEKLTIQNIEYNDVYMLYPSIYDTLINISNIYYNNKYGVLKYAYENGISFELIPIEK